MLGFGWELRRTMLWSGLVNVDFPGWTPGRSQAHWTAATEWLIRPKGTVSRRILMGNGGNSGSKHFWIPAECRGAQFAQWTVSIHIQGNEKGIGKALSAAFAEGRVKRDEVFVTTKAGKRGCASATFFDSLLSLLLRSARFQICNFVISDVAKVVDSAKPCTMLDHSNLLKARRCGLRTMVIRRP